MEDYADYMCERWRHYAKQLPSDPAPALMVLAEMLAVVGVELTDILKELRHRRSPKSDV